MASSAPGHKALGHIDTVLAGRPKKNDHELSSATMCLAEFRDRLVREWRETGLGPVQKKQLEHVNAVITVVLGVHFPLGKVHWDELEKARAWLADVVEADEPVA